MMNGFRPTISNTMAIHTTQQFPFDGRMAFQPNMVPIMRPGFPAGVRPIRLRPPPPKITDAPEEKF